MYDTTLAEVQEKSIRERSFSHHITKPAFKWLWMSIALVVAAVVAIGASVGIWRHRQHSSQHLSTAIRCVILVDPRFSRLTFIARQRHTTSLMIRPWQHFLLPMEIDKYFSKTILVSFDKGFVLHQTTNGARVCISTLARIRSISAQTPRTIHHWHSLKTI